VIEVLPGSVVEVSERQLKFLKPDFYETEEKRETPERKTKTTRKAK
jgi:hypothetical protein